MSNIVVYESKYGSTEKYAKWIAQELNCKASKLREINLEELKNYDNIIFGGWIHAGKLEGFKIIQQHKEKLKDKKLLVYAVGLAGVEDPQYQEFKEKNFKEFNNIQSFYLRGAFHFNSLKLKDKVMMSAFKMILKRQKPEKRDESTISMMNNNAKPVDFTNKEAIEPILKAIESSSL